VIEARAVRDVLIAALLTGLATGVGAIPVSFFRALPRRGYDGISGWARGDAGRRHARATHRSAARGADGRGARSRTPGHRRRGVRGGRGDRGGDGPVDSSPARPRHHFHLTSRTTGTSTARPRRRSGARISCGAR
jgi:hypothetical protein